VREHKLERAAGHIAAASRPQLLVGLRKVELGKGVRAPEVVLGEVVERKAVGEEPACERRPDDDAEASLERERKQIVLVRPRKRRVLELERRDGPHRERPFDELRRMVREPAVPNLPLRDELLQRAPRLLDRHAPVEVVELQQVDPLAPQPAEALLAAAPDRIRTEVHVVVSVVTA
jgi:hypothetical protein